RRLSTNGWERSARSGSTTTSKRMRPASALWRLGLLAHYERHLVDYAPAPVLTGLDRAKDRVVLAVRVLARVTVRRAVAAADLAAGLAHAQVQPPAADLQALLAALDRLGRRRYLDPVEVAAVDGHTHPYPPQTRQG